MIVIVVCDPWGVGKMETDLLTLAGGDLRRVATTKGGEYAGPCPLCGGRDRLRVWPDHPGGKGGQWWCRQCGKGGDLPALLVELGKLTPAEAGRMRRGDGRALVGTSAPANRPPTPRNPGRLAAPGPEWQRAARAFVTKCAAELWAPSGAQALAWLQGRGLADDTIRAAGLGYNPQDQHQPRATWGLADNKPIWLPRGVVIPWWISGDLWRVNIRRPQGEPKYFSAAGFTVGLYNADALTTDKPAILVEGEIDALTVGQAAGDLAAPVATGSTGSGRRPRWIAALAACPLVLVAYDADDAGESAAAWWVGVLANSRRWRPLWQDANAMAQAGADVRGWVLAALDGAQRAPTNAGEGDDLEVLDL
jgi:DNA primase